MSHTNPDILLVNPWITDFAAYDFWSKPLGLLYIAAVLREAGAAVELIDCMDRLDPAISDRMPQKNNVDRHYGTGKFLREIIRKPSVFAHMPRYFARYGLPLEVFRDRLVRRKQPDAVLVTSGMTYWYPGVQMAIAETRRVFPEVPVILGGIYATLMPAHATATSGADLVVTGEAEGRVIEALNRTLPHAALTPQTYDTLDDYPQPAWDLYPRLPYGIVLTSRGCPLRCSFCASQIVSGKYRWHSPERVFQEIAVLYHRYRVADIAFFDDALLTNSKNHLAPILTEIRKSGIRARFHTPNGLQCKLLTPTLAREMYACGFRTMRLSLESVSADRQQDMSKKVDNDAFVHAAQAVHEAGFVVHDLDAYVMMALPGQSLREVLRTMAFVHGQRVGIRLAAYSPIPGTFDFARAVAAGLLPATVDPLFTNNSIIPIRAPGVSYEAYTRVGLLAKRLNETLHATGNALENEQDLLRRLFAQFSRVELAAQSMVLSENFSLPSAADSKSLHLANSPDQVFGDQQISRV